MSLPVHSMLQIAIQALAAGRTLPDGETPSIPMSAKIKVGLSVVWTVAALAISLLFGSDMSSEGKGSAYGIVMLLILTAPVWLYWIGFWIFGGPFIRRPFLWLWRKVKSWRPSPHLLLGLGGYAMVVLWLSWGIYELSIDGTFMLAAEALGILLIPSAVAIAASRKANGPLPYYIACLFAAVMLVRAQWAPYTESMDARAFKAEIRGLPQDEAFAKIMRSETMTGKVMAAVIRRMLEVRKSIVELDDPRLADAMTAETLRSRNRILFMQEIAKTKRTLSTDVPVKVDAQLRGILSGDLGLPIGTSDAMTRSLIRGITENYPKIMRTTRETSFAYIKFYDGLIGVYDILLSLNGRYAVSDDGFVTIPDGRGIEIYNGHYRAIYEAAAGIDELSKKSEAEMSASLSKMSK